MTTAIRLPTRWATNVNYSSGPDAGTPTKVDPASAANGFIKGVLAAPQHVNHLINQQSAALRRPISLAAIKLRRLLPTAAGSAQDDLAESMAAVATSGLVPANAQTMVLIKASSTGVMQLQGDLPDWSSGGVIASITSLVTDCANNGTRIVAIGTGGNRCAFSTNSGGSWSAGANIGFTPESIVYNPTHSRFMLTRPAGSIVVHHSTDGTGSWPSASTTNISNGGGLAVLSNGNTVVAGVDGGADPIFSISSNGGTSWSAAGGTVPEAAAASDSGWIAGNNGAEVWHAGRGAFASGADMQICASADGSTWVKRSELTVPSGTTSKARLICCQNTGLLALIVPANAGMSALYCSFDAGFTWTEPSFYPIAIGGFCVAAGRVFASNGDGFIYGSDGIGSE